MYASRGLYFEMKAVDKSRGGVYGSKKKKLKQKSVTNSVKINIEIFWQCSKNGEKANKYNLFKKNPFEADNVVSVLNKEVKLSLSRWQKHKKGDRLVLQ